MNDINPTRKTDIIHSLSGLVDELYVNHTISHKCVIHKNIELRFSDFCSYGCFLTAIKLTSPCNMFPLIYEPSRGKTNNVVAEQV